MSHFVEAPWVLVDGSSYLYRAFHALPSLANAAGQPTGAIYGVANMLRKLIKTYSPTHMAVIFDAKGKTFRDDLYADYKAHRPTMPDELQQQIEPLHAVIRAMGLPLLCIEGVEADDVIGTLAHRIKEKGHAVLISTGDKDMAQLVDAKVTLINTMTDTLFDEKGVEDKFGLPPRLIIDYLTLMGDAVDNVPGIPGVGPKTAVKWLQAWGSLDGVIEHASDVTGKVGEALRAHREALPLSKTLVTIHTAVDLPLTLDELQRHSGESQALRTLLLQFGFNTWLKDLPTDSSEDKTPTKEAVAKKHDIILTEIAWQDWLARLKTAKQFAIDTETTSLSYMEARLAGIALAIGDDSAYVPLAHDYLGAPTQLDAARVLRDLAPILESNEIKKIGHHLKYDWHIFKHNGIDVRGPYLDTMLESHWLSSTDARHDLDSVTLKYLQQQNITFEDVAGKGRAMLTFNQVPIDKASAYAAEDAHVTVQLHNLLWPKIAVDARWVEALTNTEFPLLRVLAKMEHHGVLIDDVLLQKQSQDLGQRLGVLEEEAYRLAGQMFNLSSPKQLQEILYGKLGLPILKTTPGGQPSTAEEVLQELAHNFPLPQCILSYRTLSKLKSTYTDRLPEQICKATGRVHTSYHQAGTATGRLSSSDPNLQNIPIRSKEGRQIREAFIAPVGHVLVAADYSQIELRIMAHLSGDVGLLKAFAEGQDIHQATAAEVFGLALDAVTSEARRSAKAINFGLIYGMSAFGLARQLGIERGQAQAYVDRYFERYPGVKRYMEETRQKAKDQGFVETLFGRRLYVPEIQSRQMQRQKAAERAAINAPMQGTAADIIKRAMITIDDSLEKEHHPARMIMQVHDELVFEVPESHVEAFIPEVKRWMEGAAHLDVPLVVDVGMGRNWDEAH